MNFDNDKAFAPFYDETAVVAGTRRESGASRQLSLTVPCCVMGGDQVEVSTNSATSSNALSYTVFIRRADWPDHKSPQAGDALSISGRPEMKCLTCHPHVNDWVLACRSEGAVP